MMDFMDSLKRGVDRAGFEVDRMLRANRVRSGIGTIRSQLDEEFRQIGRQIVELYDQGEIVPDRVRERCQQVKRLEAEIAQKELELETIDGEVPPDIETDPLAAVTPRCWNCGHPVSAGARFCPQCGANLSTEPGSLPAPGGSIPPSPEPGAVQARPTEPTT